MSGAFSSNQSQQTHYSYERLEEQDFNSKDAFTHITSASEDEQMMQACDFACNQNIPHQEQLSFEVDYMSQHSAVFKIQLANYMEAAQIHLQRQGLSHVFPRGLHSLSTGMNWIELMRPCEYKIMRSLKNHEKLSEFLDIVANQCPAQIARELIHISQQVLEDFFKSGHVGSIDQAALLKFASNICTNLTNISILNLSAISPQSLKNYELMIKYHRFVEVYCATTIFLIGQFFQNPYHEDFEFKGLKRCFNSFKIYDEEEEDMQPQLKAQPEKKRKILF